MEQEKELSGIEKTAILLLSLDREAAVKLLRDMDPVDVEPVMAEISRLERVDNDDRDSVLREFYEMAVRQEYVTTGGREWVEETLDEAFGARRSCEIIKRIDSCSSGNNSVFPIDDGDSSITLLQEFLVDQHPQITAIALARMAEENPQAVSRVISRFPEKMRDDVVTRMSRLEAVQTDVLDDLEDKLRRSYEKSLERKEVELEGESLVAALLKSVDRRIEKDVLDFIESQDLKLAESIREKMIVFEDLEHMNAADVQRVLNKVEHRELVFALRNAPETLKEAIFSNMTQRRAGRLREDLELGFRVRLKDVEKAQRKIAEIMHELEERDEIMIYQRTPQDVYL